MSERTDEELRDLYVSAWQADGRDAMSCHFAATRAVYNLGLSDARAAHAAEVEGLRAALERVTRVAEWLESTSGNLFPSDGDVWRIAAAKIRAALSANPETTRRNDDD